MKRYLLALEGPNPRIMIEVHHGTITEWTAELVMGSGWHWRHTDCGGICKLGMNVVRWLPGWQAEQFSPEPPTPNHPTCPEATQPGASANAESVPSKNAENTGLGGQG